MSCCVTPFNPENDKCAGGVLAWILVGKSNVRKSGRTGGWTGEMCREDGKKTFCAWIFGAVYDVIEAWSEKSESLTVRSRRNGSL